jgi:predicted DNA-binding transcriptional regulator YafY
MPSNNYTHRMKRLLELSDLFYGNPQRHWTTSELADRMKVSVDTIRDDLLILSTDGFVPIDTQGKTNQATWSLVPGTVPRLPELRLRYDQGVAIFIATRLLAQLHDDRIDAVRTAITAIVKIMPPELRESLIEVTRNVSEHGNNHTDLSTVFSTLSNSWLLRRKVRLTYEPPHKRVYQCTFAPYLIEPSAIGYTVYFIGHSDLPDQLRTYKLERIRHAELTDEPFVVPDDFDGPKLLQTAWRVMFGEGESSAHIKLRFSSEVSGRVRETRWHPSEHLTNTDAGLIWEADIGDITEIRPWIRGWGGNCEVLEPATLRTDLIREVHRMQRLYRLESQSQTDDKPDLSLLDDLLHTEE